MLFDIITEKCSDDTMILHVSSLVGIGDLEEDDRMDFDTKIERHGDSRFSPDWKVFVNKARKSRQSAKRKVLSTFAVKPRVMSSNQGKNISSKKRLSISSRQKAAFLNLLVQNLGSIK